jgi:hypothetical protein
MKFKNLRRPARAKKAGISVLPKPKTKVDSLLKPTAVQPSTSDIDEYEQHIKYIQKCYASKKWSVTSMTLLLEQTAVLRRKWIQEECPIVKEVIEKFPCLTEPKLVGDIILFIGIMSFYLHFSTDPRLSMNSAS